MFDFDAFDDLTGSFNHAIHAGASLAATGMAVGTIFGLASAPKKDEDPELKPLKAAAKLSLLGMVM
jgi:hypothetical protein